MTYPETDLVATIERLQHDDLVTASSHDAANQSLVRFELSPQGLPNPFHDDLVKARTTTNNEQVQLQSPASASPHHPAPHDAALSHQPAHGTRRLRCLSWPTSAPMPLITPELRSRGLFP